MRVIKNIERLGEPCCAALGYFDGVHIGHAAVIAKAKKRADELGTELVVFTFYFESSRLQSKGAADIFSTAERLNRLSRLGVDAVYVLPFGEIRGFTDERFVNRVLRDTMCARAVFTGPDFRFGCGGESGVDRLSELCKAAGIEAHACPEVALDGVRVSSTEIKRLLLAGDIETANRMLGIDYGFSLEVVEGDKRGRELGFATANQYLPLGVLAPKRGVYVSEVEIEGKPHRAITNVGVRPTFYSDGAALIETHIFEYSGDLYGEYLPLRFIGFLRDERRFDSGEQLSRQINEDCAAALEYRSQQEENRQ